MELNNTFDIVDKLFDTFTDDEELMRLIGIDDLNDYEAMADKVILEDINTDMYDADKLNFIAIYFNDGDTTDNYLINRALLRIDIYACSRDDAKDIRKRIVDIMHNAFDIRVTAEGQTSAGIVNVYKYRLEFLPLVFN